MKTLKIKAQPRAQSGTAAAGRLRQQGLLPAIVYGAGKPGRLVQLNAHSFQQALRGHAGEHMLMDLEVEGSGTTKVLIKEIQHHPVTGHIIHADFNEVSMTEKLRVEVPVRLVGEPVGVTQQGGILEHLLRQVAVECLPSDLVESLSLDVSGLSIGDSLTVANIQLDPARYTILTAKDVAVATVAAPRIEEEPTPAAAVEGEGAPAEPEVITAKKEEGEEGEESEPGKKGEGKKAEGKKPEAKKEEAGKKPEPAKKEEGKKGK